MDPVHVQQVAQMANILQVHLTFVLYVALTVKLAPPHQQLVDHVGSHCLQVCNSIYQVTNA
jgi:hypothetical protein